MKTFSQLIILYAALTAVSCGSSQDTALAKSNARFIVLNDSSGSNFITFEAQEVLPSTVCSWDFGQGLGTYEGKRVTRYFPKAGSYDITLTMTDGKKKATGTQTIHIQNDSWYELQHEALWWNDEFNGPEIDPQAWNYETGIGKWGNHEWENYTNSAENSFIRDGKLVIKAIKTGVGQKIGDYTSARLTTRGKKEIHRGRVEVRAKLAGGVGMWPAIWFYGTAAQPAYSELDMMEYVGCDKNIIYTTVHTSHTLSGKPEDKITASVSNLGDVEKNFHVYGMNWTDQGIEFYIDHPSNVYLTFNPEDKSDPQIWPFNHDLYLILNVAVGGDWGGMHGVDDHAFPSEMEVDYVRIFKK